MSEGKDLELDLYSDIRARVIEKKHSKEMSEFFARSDMTMSNPDRVTEILFLWSQGWSQTKICKKLKADPYSVSTIIVEYADFVGNWRELCVGHAWAMREPCVSYVREDVKNT